MDRAQPDQPERPYRRRRGGANRRVQVFYNAQDLASGAIRRLVRIQGDTPNFILPRRTNDVNDPYVALSVNVDWYGVQSLLADEVTRLAPYIAEPDAGAEEEEPDDLTDVEVEPEEVAADDSAEGVVPAAAISPPPGLKQPEQSQEGRSFNKIRWRRKWEQVTQLLHAEAERQEEEDTVADFAASSFHQRKITSRTSVRCNPLLSLLLPKATRRQQQRPLR